MTPLVTGGCVQTFFQPVDDRPPLAGRIDLETGSVTVERFLNIVGGTNLPENCPRCEGDPMSNDGLAEGTCRVSPYPPAHALSSFNRACDVHGNGTFGPLSGAYSLDCSPSLEPSISLDYSGSRTAGARMSLQASDVTCNGRKCWCGLCEGTYESCHQDGDCTAGRACLAPNDIPVPSAPNGCRNRCNWDEATQRGTCVAADPPTPDGGLPPERLVSCFPGEDDSEMVAFGSSRRTSEDSFTIEMGNVSCRDPLRDAMLIPVAVNNDMLFGLPGPQLSVLRFQVDLEF